MATKSEPIKCDHGDFERCINDSEAQCDSCGTETCTSHGSPRGNPEDLVFVCYECQGEIDREVTEDDGPEK